MFLKGFEALSHFPSLLITENVVYLTSSKVLPLGNTQINLVLRSLIRTFANELVLADGRN